ncbi:DUF3954 domain-containing protein [Evansella clarkii]|uniref:DUF3954 domain-containing protein n=1 Tax=Evansella clarkii TaxID=79879 RepID=UPI000B43986F|nr:DUF3954 domain-containing protein [Evansella clarkii]
MKSNQDKKTAIIDITQNCIYVIKNGVPTKIERPVSGHGKQTAVWKDGVVIDVLKEERQRI